MDAFHNQVLAQPVAEERPTFWAEFQEYWSRVPDKWLFLTMLAGWFVLFQFLGISSFNFDTTVPSLFAWLYNAWNWAPMDCSQGNLIPFVVLALFWARRRTLAASITGLWWPGVVIVGLALLIHALGFLAQQPRVSMIGLFLGLYAMIGVAWGWRTMWASTFPMVLFAFCMPLGIYSQVVTFPMRMISVTLTRMVCHGVLDINVVQLGTSLWDAKGRYEFDVVAACSGIHGLLASLAVATVVALQCMQSIWKRALMMAATFPLAICGNVLRLSVVVLTGQAYGQAPAKWVHDWFGYVTYLLVNIGSLLLLAHWLREKPTQASA